MIDRPAAPVGRRAGGEGRGETRRQSERRLRGGGVGESGKRGRKINDDRAGREGGEEKQEL